MLTIHQASTRDHPAPRPRMGLAVAGGGPVGAVYELGALRALEDSIQGLRLHELDVYVGVSAGAFIAASLANRIPCAEQCRIFMGSDPTDVKFLPERFLRPAYREYIERAARVPGIVSGALRRFLKHPAQASVSELINELGQALPSGIFDNEGIHRFLRRSFESAGRGDRFDDLDCTLYVVAVDLDNGQAVRFGSAENRDVPISRAVQASAALPGLYPPVRIGGRHYVDGALRRTLHASAALDEGLDLMLGINPLVPYDSSREALHIPTRRLIRGGLPLILSQTFRAMIQSRMQVGFAKYRTRYPETDLLLLEPARDDETLFFTNIFSYASRMALCEHAFQSTRRELTQAAERLAPLLEPYGLALDEARLRDTRRSLMDSVSRQVPSHTPISRRLDSVLEELEALLDRRSA